MNASKGAINQNWTVWSEACLVGGSPVAGASPGEKNVG